MAIDAIPCLELGPEVGLRVAPQVREHSVAKIPVQLAVGQREVETRSVAVRRLGSKKQQVVTLDEIVEQLTAEVANRT